MKKRMLSPLLILAAIACSDDRDDTRGVVDQTEPDTECAARCSERLDECVVACDEDTTCLVGCDDQARDCNAECR